MKIFLNDRAVHFVAASPTESFSTDLIIGSDPEAIKTGWTEFSRYEKFKNLYIVAGNSEPISELKNTQDFLRHAWFKAFASLFRYVPAAGGLVRNEREEFLFIHRLGYWDLPKGKISLKEDVAAGLEISEEQRMILKSLKNHDDALLDHQDLLTSVARNAAIREVKEETGLKEVTITNDLPSTWHIYKEKDFDILKQTFWFEMHADSAQPLTPQVSEGIFLVKWTSPRAIHCILSHTYASIRELLLDLLF
jgi:8-oxo-dGTP pyrophosphatase MutT (NUDIX family)